MSADSLYPTQFPFLPPFLQHIFENASTPTLIKLSQCSKGINEKIRKIYGFFCDRLSIVQFDSIPYRPIFLAENGYLSMEFKTDDRNLLNGNSLKVKDQLNLYLKEGKNIAEIMKKVDLSCLLKIDINGGYMNAQIFMDMFKLSLIKIDIRRTSIEGIDALEYIIAKCQNVKELLLPSQFGVTSMKKCAAILNETRLKHFVLTEILESFEVHEIADFADNHMIENSELWLLYCPSVRKNVPIDYSLQIEKLIHHKNIRIYIS